MVLRAKKKVYLYVKNSETLDFLEAYFQGSRKYSAEFFTNLRVLKKAIKDSPPGMIAVEAPGCLDMLKPKPAGPPVLAVISSDLAHSMRSILSNKVDHYIAPPFERYDMDCKLSILTRKDEYVEVLTQELDDLRTLSQLTDFLSTTLDPQEILHMIVKKISEHIPVSRCSILGVRHEGDDTVQVVSTFEDRSERNLYLDLKKYPEIKEALETRKSVVIKDAQKAPVMNPVLKAIKGLDIKSIAVIPIVFRSEIIGTLFLRTSRKKYEFSEREIKLFQEIANAASKALNNAFLFMELSQQRSDLEKLAITDYLTGIYNIRYLYHCLESEFSLSMRHGTPLSCLMFDIDHFKRVNDTYGHRTGDMVLMEFASLIQGHTRKSDIFARYGGEEFVMLLPHAGMEGALSKARMIKNAVEEHRFKGLKRSANFTISIGISACPHKKIKDQDDLIRLADEALLRAKDEGRNRILVFE
ncbi:MAG TPA: sensor domain-containing diguanylate cyclase [Nitrospirae bacterium]|nr:sensor domain-containing diguanylate cyclase [Nitrospirota bacterium]